MSEFNVVDPLFKGLHMPTYVPSIKVRCLLLHGSNLGQMHFLPPPMTPVVPVGVEHRLAGC